MTEIITRETSNVWITTRTWTEPEERVEQEIERAAFGAPSDPADAGRLAVDAHGEDLRRLADN